MPGRGFVAVAATTVEGFMVIVFFFMCAMAYAAAVFFIFLCVVFSTSAHAFFFFFHNWLVLFFCKVTDTFLQPGCKGGKIQKSFYAVFSQITYRLRRSYP